VLSPGDGIAAAGVCVMVTSAILKFGPARGNGLSKELRVRLEYLVERQQKILEQLERILDRLPVKR